jgi:hypothetical protein
MVILLSLITLVGSQCSLSKGAASAVSTVPVRSSALYSVRAV